MATQGLHCPNCGTGIIQSSCMACRRKIHTYKCQRCGTNVPNPEYGKP